MSGDQTIKTVLFLSTPGLKGGKKKEKNGAVTCIHRNFSKLGIATKHVKDILLGHSGGVYPPL
jgi:hypothetical protein